MEMARAYMIVSKEQEVREREDFMWHCTANDGDRICGAMGRGNKSLAAHNKKYRHGLKQIFSYRPEERLDKAEEIIKELLARIGRLEEDMPDEDAFVLAPDDLRTLIARCVNQCFDDQFEERAAFGNEHGQTIDHITRLVWNERFWEGFLKYNEEREAQYQRELEEHRAKAREADRGGD